MGFDATNSKVYELLNDREYIVPSNQRKYVWTKNNWRELLDDIELVFQERSHDHFIGSVVLKRESGENGIRNRFSVIDGQQRVLTLTVMLCAIGLIFAENGDQENFNGLNKPLFVMDNKNRPHPIVSIQANKSISKIVTRLFENVNSHFEAGTDILPVDGLLKEVKAEGKIKDCFKCFYEWFCEKTNSDMAKLSKYREIIDDIRCINIIAEEEDAYTIFEILNARGQPLTDFELLRNFLLKYSTDSTKENVKQKIDELEDLLGKDADMFLKHYVIHRYGLRTDKNENRPYKILVAKQKQAEKDQMKMGGDPRTTSQELIDDLVKKAKYYEKITTFERCSTLEEKVFSFFKPRRQQQFRPIVLSMMDQKDRGNLTEDTYEKYLEFLYEFFICYHVIGEQASNKIDDVVFKYAVDLENRFGDNTLSDFRKSMVKRIPSKENFYNSIKRIRYSNRWKAYSDNKKRENVRAIFEIIERELGYTGNFEDCNIEHCIPDAQSEENAHIGNLFLLESTINENKCKDKPLGQKICFYKESKLKLPAKMAEENPQGNSFDFEKRSEWIADFLYSYIINIRES